MNRWAVDELQRRSGARIARAVWRELGNPQWPT